jgi:hypothetical protein
VILRRFLTVFNHWEKQSKPHFRLNFDDELIFQTFENDYYKEDLRIKKIKFQLELKFQFSHFLAKILLYLVIF